MRVLYTVTERGNIISHLSSCTELRHVFLLTFQHPFVRRPYYGSDITTKRLNLEEKYNRVIFIRSDGFRKSEVARTTYVLLITNCKLPSFVCLFVFF